jgi:hypothetical protein
MPDAGGLQDVKMAEFTDEELNVILGNGCNCSHCGESIFGLSDFPTIKNGYVYCEECETELFFDTCPICENLFEKPETPEQHRFVLTKEQAGGEGMKPGIYQVKKFPFYRAALVFGFESFFDDAIELVREMDINAVLEKIRGRKQDVAGDCICPDCFDKYTMRKPVKTRYCNPRTGVHRNINERNAIAAGK